MRPSDSGPLTRTKLVATLGPATSSPERLAEILNAGVDVCRLNFSHGSYNDHKTVLDTVRQWSTEHNRPVAVLGDLCGPKIRLNDVRGGAIELKRGDTVRIERGSGESTAQRFTTTYGPMVGEVQAGHRIYIDDGMVRLLVTDKDSDALICTCTVAGTVSSRKGVNLPDTQLATPALTDKDKRDLDWAIEQGLDYVALSFVRHANDLKALRKIIDERGSDIGTIVKIEKIEALEHLDALVAGSDGLMVARGDLGVEMDVWQVPLVQKSITARCREAGKPVIVATQLLQSMIVSPTPTRAEVSDVANAILDGVDAVMLSAETAAGQFPGVAVDVIHRVAQATEVYQTINEKPAQAPASLPLGNRRVSAVAQAAVEAALHLDARVVAVWSRTGETVRLVARNRLPMPVVGLTFDERVFRRMNLFYGVVPTLVPPLSNPIEMAEQLDSRLIEEQLASTGDLIVVVTSSRPEISGSTDTTLVHRVGGST